MANDKKGKDKANRRRALGRARPDASFPVPPPALELPADYAGLLDDLKRRIAGERLRIVLTANSAMVLLYWDVGLKYMRAFAAAWPARTIVQRVIAQLPWRQNVTLRGYTKPIGVAEWETRITKALPEELRSSLPSIEELEKEFDDIKERGR